MKDAQRKVTLKDIAAEAGVSITAVSLILNRAKLAKRLSPQTRSRVEELALRLGYTPDPVARSLQGRQSGMVGVMTFDITDPYCTRLLQGIQTSLMKTAYLPLIMSTGNEAELVERYWKAIVKPRVQGIIVIANWSSVDVELFRGFRQGPFVMVGATPPVRNVPHVAIDNVDGGARALAYLYQLGHRKIGVLRGPRDVIDSVQRWQGVQHFASEVGLKLAAKLCPQMNALPHPTSIVDEADRLATLLIEQKREFTALLTFDDLSAIGALRALDRHQWKIPRDCSVIGFDDIPYAQLVHPALTTMRQPLEQMGAMAVENLLIQISNQANGLPGETLAKVVQAELVVRQSTTTVAPS